MIALVIYELPMRHSAPLSRRNVSFRPASDHFGSGRTRLPPASLSQIRLQAAHEGRKAGLPLALEALGGEDRLHLGEGAADVAVDHHVVVFGPVAHLGGGGGHAAG